MRIGVMKPMSIWSKRSDTAIGFARNLFLWPYLPWLVFACVVSLVVVIHPIPALSGDEYNSLYEADHLAANPHAIGYFLQLHFWKMLSEDDLFLRSLSVIWVALGMYWLKRWLSAEGLDDGTRQVVVLLVVANPFLWVYGFAIRFYAYFFASAILFLWRFRVWQQRPVRRNGVLFLLSALQLCTAHLFGWLVLGIGATSALWKLLGSKRWYLAGGLALIALMLLIPEVRQFFVVLVYRVSNPYAEIPSSSLARGLTLAMLAKLPLTFYSFVLGEHIYPLWWWITVPGMAVFGALFLVGLWQLRRYSGLNVLAALILLSVAAMYLVLDPLAPSGLQGAAPRYVLYALPIFLLVVALGAATWKPLIPIVIAVCLVGLANLLWPVWGSDGLTMDWRSALQRIVPEPQQTCMVVDGRASAPVARYAPAGMQVVRDQLAACLGAPRIVIVTNDYRLEMTRPFDAQVQALEAQYDLATSISQFPAQITAYDRTAAGATQLMPSRLSVPEQDVRLPIEVPQRGWQINGFVRLDSTSPTAHVPVRIEGPRVWIATNYRADHGVAPGTPIVALIFHGTAHEDLSMVLRAGVETDTWEGQCSACIPIATWTKLVHLVGQQYYPGAYSQYQATIWGTPALQGLDRITSVDLASLLPQGTVYFWGLYSTASEK